MSGKFWKDGKGETWTHKALRYTRGPRYFLYAVGILFVLVTWANFPFPVLNPANPPIPFNWVITYPPSPPNTLAIPDSSVIVMVTVSTPESFTDGLQVTIHARACESAEYVDTVKDVFVGFNGAYWYPLDENTFQVSPPYGGVDMLSAGTNNQGLVWICGGAENATVLYLQGASRDVEFRAVGNYPLTLKITYSNGSDPTILTYQDFILPIQSTLSERQARVNNVIEVTTIVGFSFVALDLIPEIKKSASTPSQK